MKNKYILLALSFCFLVYNSQATTYYVKTTGNNSSAGTSWASAKADLQEAINASASGDQIWIAQGTYCSTLMVNGFAGSTQAEQRDQTFYNLGGKTLYGGFAGTETLITQRNISINPVILSGNIGNVSVNTDNCYHVLIVPSGAVTIDGLTISCGIADLPLYHYLEKILK